MFLVNFAFPAIHGDDKNPRHLLSQSITFLHNYISAPFSRRADYIKYYIYCIPPTYNACIEALVCAIHSAIYFIYPSFGAITCEIYTLYIMYVLVCTYM